MGREGSATDSASLANERSQWDKIWKNEGTSSWRKDAMGEVYARIAHLIPEAAHVVDVGGGVGQLASHLRRERGALVLVRDHSVAAVEICLGSGIDAAVFDLRTESWPVDRPGTIYTMTECLEHFSSVDRAHILGQLRQSQKTCFISVPNNRLGPDEEPQHAVKFTALSFLEELRSHFGAAARVEVLGPYLLGVCGPAAEKSFRLSMTMPVRDEAADIESVLASFRGCCDEIVIGVDPRSTDRTFEIASQYAETVFYLTELDGPEDDKVSADVPEDRRIHFAHARNQCMARCTGDWIFMTEGHERLGEGHDVLLHLDQIPGDAEIAMVLRTGQGQQWGFPWLCRNRPHLRYKRSTHNVLDYPAGTGCVNLPQVKTIHDRVHERSKARSEQRKAQNRVTLLEDWLYNANSGSLFYLGSEYREDDPEKAVEYLQMFLETEKAKRAGPMRYHCRLVLAKTLANLGRRAEAREVLVLATGDDWSRIEHFMFLGDLAFEDGDFAQAESFYRLMATRIGEPPFTVWWIDLSVYGYLAAQRLAACYGELGRRADSLHWARRVLDLLPEGAPEAVLAEVHSNIALLEENQ